MIRALYTAASGMSAQQSNMDNIAHNLSNVNTAGFKKSRVEFSDLVYQELRVAGAATSTTGEAPVGLEFGLGTRPVGTARDFASGNIRMTNGPLDLAIQGGGFFQVNMPDGTVGYTRAGRLIDMLERRGAISGYEGSKPRQVLIAEGDIPRIMGGGGGAVATAPADDEPPFAHDGD